MAESYLERLSGEHVGEIVALDKEQLTIGRDRTCDVVTDPTIPRVSGLHAVIRKDPHGWSLSDVGTGGQGSSYGTFVNGVSLTANVRQILYSQDEICLGGKTGMYFRFATSGTLQEAERATDTIGARLRVSRAV